MSEAPNWYYDESLLSEVDYLSQDLVEQYDGQHRKFRDYQAESREIVDILGLPPESTVLDMGAGTGAFVLNAAGYYQRVIAVDVSPPMVAYCRAKAQKMGLCNLTCLEGGFLSYRHAGPAVDAVVSMVALHHLPDQWKQVALKRLAGIIKPGGLFLLQDVVLPSQDDECDRSWGEWVRAIAGMGGQSMGEEAAIHIKQEHSTYDWIMEGMLRRAGFSLESAVYRQGMLARYLCRK